MAAEGFRFDLREASGALGDLGTLAPLMLGAIAVAGLAPTPVLLGFGLAYVATAVFYRLPIPVQPMKAVAAVMLTAEMTPAGLAVGGVVIGIVLLVLGVTGWIDRLGRVVPQSILAGLQLGLGAALALLALDLLAGSPALGAALVLLLAALLRFPRLPAAVIGLGCAIAAGQAFDLAPLPLPQAPWAAPALGALPSLREIEQAFAVVVLPQLALTLTNAVILTALVAGDCFGPAARHVTPRRLCLSTGALNLLLAPFGALPMCHGAGGVAAHHRFGARSGGAPLMLGLALVAIALAPGGAGLALITAIPAAGLGALLLIASVDLAFSRRLFDSRPSCWPVIGATAVATVVADPFFGLVAGAVAEAGRVMAVRALRRSSRG